MRPRGIAGIAMLAAALIVMPCDAAAQDGTIEGVIRSGGRTLRHVVVELQELARVQETEADGRYRFTVPAGTYTLLMRLAGFSTIQRDVVVMAGTTTAVDTTVTWPLFHLETVTVWTPARYPERMEEASAAAIGLLEGDFRAQVTHAQLPRVLASAPGVELVQSGLYDFTLNARGFNTATNRHIKTMIDGRDPSVPVLLGYQDWAANLFPLDEIERTELIRGPGAALYGAGAFNGVLNITTTAPRLAPGGYVRYTGGGLRTSRLEARHAGSLGPHTGFKVLGGYHHSADFTRARVNGVEYGEGRLPREVVAPPHDRLQIAFGSLRIDRAFGGRALVAEAGTSYVTGLTTVTSAGRTQASSNLRPWARTSFGTPRWTLSAYYSGQKTGEQTSLSSGAPVYLAAHNVEAEFVANHTFGGGRGRVVAGGSLGWQYVDSTNPDGRQTVFWAARHVKRDAVFGEAEYRVLDRVRAIAAVRVDQSDLHDPAVSPRIAAVFRLTPRQHLRVSASRGFQSPSVTEFFLSTPVAPPVDLSALEDALAPILGGTPLGFGAVPILAVGNEGLKIERVSGVEAGYTATVGRHLHLTVDYYRSRLRDFTSNLLPQLGTSLGLVNPAYGPYAPPATLSPAAAAAVQQTLALALPPQLFPLLSNGPAGTPLFAALSFRNVGDATTQGIETGVHAELRPRWRVTMAYSLFTHDLADQDADAAFFPNAARHRWSAGTSYDDLRWSVAAQYRWVDAFQWSSGLFSGPVPSFAVVDLQGLYSLTDAIAVGVDVANLFDRQHYEIFGGDILRRRALLSIRYGW